MGKPTEMDDNKGAPRMPNPLPKRLFSIKDAAAYLGFSVRSIRNLVYSRQLPIVRLGTKMFFDIKDLDLWIESNKRFA